MLSLATLTDQPNLEASRYAEELKSMNENQEQSANYEFTRLELCEEEFMNLVFMHPSHAWEEPFLKGLCLKPLARVVEHVKRRAQLAKQPKYYGQHYDHSRDTQATTIFEDAHVLAKTDDDTSWFEKHRQISVNFNPRFMPRIWIRNLSETEKRCNPSCNFYLDDGNTRALIYAMRLSCGEEPRERLVKAIHATSWDFTYGILGHVPQHASELLNEGKLVTTHLSSNTKIKQPTSWNRSTNKYF